MYLVNMRGLVAMTARFQVGERTNELPWKRNPPERSKLSDMVGQIKELVLNVGGM